MGRQETEEELIIKEKEREDAEDRMKIQIDR